MGVHYHNLLDGGDSQFLHFPTKELRDPFAVAYYSTVGSLFSVFRLFMGGFS